MEAVGQTDQGFTRIPVSHAFGVGNGISKTVIHDIQPGGVRIAEPCHLNWRGLVSKHKKTVIRSVSGQVHKNVNAVFSYLFCNCRVALSQCATPGIRK